MNEVYVLARSYCYLDTAETHLGESQLRKELDHP